jgi:hypothetical protein
VGKEVVTSNDANTLTITNPGFVPDTTTKYIIMDTFGVATAGTSTTLTDTTKLGQLINGQVKDLFIFWYWSKNRSFHLLKYSKYTYIFFLTIVPDTTTYTTILVFSRSVGVGLRWIFGNTDADLKGTFNMSKRW